MDKKQIKPVIWVGSSHEDWKTFPDDVQDVMGYALHLAQYGEKAGHVTILIIPEFNPADMQDEDVAVSTMRVLIAKK